MKFLRWIGSGVLRARMFWWRRFPGSLPLGAARTLRRAIEKQIALTAELGFGLVAVAALILESSFPDFSVLSVGWRSPAVGVFMFVSLVVLTRAIVAVLRVLGVIGIVGAGALLGPDQPSVSGSAWIPILMGLISLVILGFGVWMRREKWTKKHLIVLFLVLVALFVIGLRLWTFVDFIGLLGFAVDRVGSVTGTAWVVFFFLVTWTVLAGSVSLMVIDPKTWAQVQIEARGSEHVFKACGRLSEVLAREFLNATAEDEVPFKRTLLALEKLNGKPGMEAPKHPPSGMKVLEDYWMPSGDMQAAMKRRRETVVENVAVCLVNQRILLQRMEALKEVGARELGVPFRTFCDHVLQFSPTIYEELAVKYRNNWLEIARGGRRTNSGDIERAIGLIRECYSTRRSIHECIGPLRNLVRFAYLAPAISSMASAGSTSEGVRRYAEALSLAFRRRPPWLRGLTKRARSNNRVPALGFVLSRRRAHPGVDPHIFLESICKREEHERRREGEEDGADPARLSEYLALLNWLLAAKGPEPSPSTDVSGAPSPPKSKDAGDGGGRTPKAGEGTQRPLEVKQAEDHLLSRETGPLEFPTGKYVDLRKPGSLDKLGFYVAQHMADAHRKIAKYLAKTVNDFRTKVINDGGTLHVITLGFSRTVRQALTSPSGEDERARVARARTNLYVATGPDSNSLATRLMQFHLKREAKRHHGHVLFGSIVSVTPDFLAGSPLPGDGVLILVGAKAWDQQGRVIAARGYQELVEQVALEREKDSGYGEIQRPPDGKPDVKTMVVAVGEEYKKLGLESDSKLSLAMSNEFYRNDDALDLLRKGRVDVILSQDGEAYPSPHEGAGQAANVPGIG